MKIVNGVELGTQLCMGIDELKIINKVVNDRFIKPIGGFWTSTFRNNSSDWLDWCTSNGGFSLQLGINKGILLEVLPTAKILVIDCVEDLREVAKKYELKTVLLGSSFCCLDFEKIKDDFDGVNLTEKGQQDTRFSHPSLYGWDCESTLWFRDVFKVVRNFEF